jgi:hypothetical protein
MAVGVRRRARPESAQPCLGILSLAFKPALRFALGRYKAMDWSWVDTVFGAGVGIVARYTGPEPLPRYLP